MPQSDSRGTSSCANTGHFAWREKRHAQGQRIAVEAVALSNPRMNHRWKDVADGVVVTGINGTSIRGIRTQFLIFGQVDYQVRTSCLVPSLDQLLQSDNPLYLKRPSLDLDKYLERELSLAFDRQLLNLAGALLAQDRPFAYTSGELCVTVLEGVELRLTRGSWAE
ncbi:hypothetical protein B0H17DRAFT_1139828 [Mycena rosella]|uniref:Uncharacterized protein n=1 Tax=Mycena rosella TaxID=1033263 RepID=A0AAD7D3Q2_MYCRO|nr:hypothetical protein B0H17DRAFT_1139828 [Mycena rosella]